jgi:hypothetical protein
MAQADQLTAQRAAMSAPTIAKPAAGLGIAAAVLGLAALSFLLPSAPTYDPWAWIIWGREVLHLDLSTTDGPSWKPLPVMATTVFAAAGDVAPDLWLFTARAGALAGVVFAFRVARRLGGTPAGIVAAVAYAAAPWSLRNAALGNSEGLLVALALAAVDRHAAGARRAAFGLGLGAALLRPEAWPLLGLYAGWLAWRDPGARLLVAAGLAAIPICWFLPELWGSGDPLRAMHRARDPRLDSPAFADDPVGEVLRQFWEMLTVPLWVGGGALLAAGLAARAPTRAELRLAVALLAAAAVWVAEVALMTSDGFSGNSRYLVLPAAVACVLIGAGAGWGLRAAGVRGALGAAAATAGVALAATPWATELDRVMINVQNAARVTDQLDSVLTQAGGSHALLACGEPYTGPFQVPLLAWHLGVHTSRVRLDPRAPAVIVRTRNRPHGPAVPTLAHVGDAATLRTLAAGRHWRVVVRCRPGSTPAAEAAR